MNIPTKNDCVFHISEKNFSFKMSLHVIPQKLKSIMTNILSKTRVNFRKSENSVEFERGYRASYNILVKVGWINATETQTGCSDLFHHFLESIFPFLPYP